MQYCLQNRWMHEGDILRYYGMRSSKRLFHNTVRLSRKQKAIISSLPRELEKHEIRALGRLVGEQIVTLDALRKTPSCLHDARFCVSCAANEFMIPGIEFDKEGRCPMCARAGKMRNIRSILPVMTDIPHSEKSRFDIALFYTGGKDSAYLLYYLSKVKKLRVLALTWEIPFMSRSARQSIKNAEERFPDVEFVSRAIPDAELKKIYSTLYELSGNTCACPTPAYAIFYPDMVREKVPYFAAGNEPVQMLGLYYNHMAPAFAYRLSQSAIPLFFVNIGRIFTLRPPLKRGQLHTLLTVKQIVGGEGFIQKKAGYGNPLTSNIIKALHEVPHITDELKASIKSSSRSGNIPAFIHFDLDEVCGGEYDWKKVKKILIDECGWVPPEDDGKALHTSCSIERCKDHTQFVRFYNCKSTMIPFSAIEISLAARNCGRTREENISEIENSLGFTLNEIPECAVMRGYIGK